MEIEDLAAIRTLSELKTTLNLTLVDEKDFDMDLLKGLFDSEKFFVKLSPINPNEVSEAKIGSTGVITPRNIA